MHEYAPSGMIDDRVAAVGLSECGLSIGPGAGKIIICGKEVEGAEMAPLWEMHE